VELLLVQEVLLALTVVLQVMAVLHQTILVAVAAAEQTILLEALAVTVVQVL
jgi:hypothetical protein